MDNEALATVCAIELGIELGITHAVLEGDLGMIVKALADEVFSWLPTPLWYKMQRYYLSLYLNCFTLTLGDRAKKLAHALGRYFINVSDFFFFLCK